MPEESSTKFLTVLGTMWPNRPISMVPIFFWPMFISKNTLSVIWAVSVVVKWVVAGISWKRKVKLVRRRIFRRLLLRGFIIIITGNLFYVRNLSGYQSIFFFKKILEFSKLNVFHLSLKEFL